MTSEEMTFERQLSWPTLIIIVVLLLDSQPVVVLPLNAERQAGKVTSPLWKVSGVTKSRFHLGSTAPEELNWITSKDCMHLNIEIKWKHDFLLHSFSIRFFPHPECPPATSNTLNNKTTLKGYYNTGHLPYKKHKNSLRMASSVIQTSAQ